MLIDASNLEKDNDSKLEQCEEAEVTNSDELEQKCDYCCLFRAGCIPAIILTGQCQNYARLNEEL